MTIAFEEFKARLLSNPKVKSEYDALEAEFKSFAEGRDQNESNELSPQEPATRQSRRV